MKIETRDTIGKYLVGITLSGALVSYFIMMVFYR